MFAVLVLLAVPDPKLLKRCEGLGQSRTEPSLWSAVGRRLASVEEPTNILVFFLAKKLPKNEPQNAPGGPGRNRVVDLQESSQPSRSQCCSN